MTTTPHPTPEAVEAAIAYSSINHRVDAMSEDVQRILWANVKPDCTGYSSAYALTAARILAAEVERLRKMCVHCPDCGADYLATGVEAGCPCKLQVKLDQLQEAAHSVLDWYVNGPTGASQERMQTLKRALDL